MDEYYNCHYVTVDEQNRITDGWSDGPHPERDTAGAICISDQGDYQFRLVPGGEENPPICTMDGIPLYKWDGEQVIQRTEEEIEQDKLPSHILSKTNLIRQTCRNKILEGFDLTLSKGKEHFSLEETDQINLTTATAAIQEGAISFPYHSDGNVCRLYSAREISLISNAATQHKLYHTTLCNHLLQCIKKATTKEELDNITYGEDCLPEDLRKSFDAIIQASKEI